MIRVAIIDDHPAILEWFSGAVAQADGLDLTCAENSIEAFDRAIGAARRAGRALPGVVLVDLGLTRGKLGGAAGVAHIAGQGLAVLVLSASDNREAVLAALESGARGYVVKTAATSDVLTAIREVAAGHLYVSPTLAGYLLRLSRDSGTPALTAREQQVLTHVATGMTDSQIAAQLAISPSTVRSHLDNIGAKLGNRHRAALAAHAHRLGLIPPGASPSPGDPP
jgi:DNA-binding NarL/FixJ family response regulator